VSEQTINGHGARTHANGSGRHGELAPLEDETVDGTPVVAASPRAFDLVRPVALPAVQVATVAATGFVAGVATAAVLRRRKTRKLIAGRGRRKRTDRLHVLSSRSFLVDIHLVGRS
jgi:hypothetical protein